MKTKFASFVNNGIAEGCKYCIRGEKLVLFMGGACSRSCWYCSLSNSRKKSKVIYANERPIKKIQDLIQEAKDNNAKGAGITGGDPLIQYKKTLSYSKELKKEFGPEFHIHIYLPMKLVTQNKIKALSENIDEFRFHPSFLIDENEKNLNEEIEKIKMISQLIGKERTGIELPIIPNRIELIYYFIEKIQEYISFVNLNEFELSETNFKKMIKDYSLNEDTYTIFNSLNKGKEILKRAKKDKLKLNIHLCSAITKDVYQYNNRMLNHIILPFGKQNKNGIVTYYCIYYKSLKKDENKLKKITNKYYLDKQKKRFIIPKAKVRKILRKTKLKIDKIKEYPYYHSDYLERTPIK